MLVFTLPNKKTRDICAAIYYGSYPRRQLTGEMKMAVDFSQMIIYFFAKSVLQLKNAERSLYDTMQQFFVRCVIIMSLCEISS